MLDLQSGSLIGEVPDIGWSPTGLAVTPDGKFAAAYHTSGQIDVLDLEAMTPIYELYHRVVHSVQFLPGRPLRVFTGSPGLTPSAVYNAEAGTLDSVLPEVAVLCLNAPDDQEFVTIVGSPDWPTGWGHGLIRRSSVDWTVIDSFGFVSPATQDYIRVTDAVLSPDYDAIYVLASDAAGLAFFRYSLADHSCTFRRELVAGTKCDFALSPDGREAWVVQCDSGFARPSELGYFMILNALTGAVLDTIRTVGHWSEYPEYPLPLLGPIAFQPESERVYAGLQWNRESLVVINAKTREIVGIVRDLGPVYDLNIVPL